jgi:alkylation response protein AidB-like acyl-CoA dehydrogenase
VRALGEHGLLSRVLDGEIPALDLCLIREGLARHCTEAETAFAVQGLGAHPILANGGPELVAEWLPRLARGELVSGFALTEPGAGSDVAALTLRAERDGGAAIFRALALLEPSREPLALPVERNSIIFSVRGADERKTA